MAIEPRSRPEDRARDDSGVRFIAELEAEDTSQARALAGATSPDLVAFLLECASGAVFVLDASSQVVAMSRVAAALVRRAGPEVIDAVAGSHHTVVDTRVGPLRVSRRQIATSERTHHLVLHAEPFAVDADTMLQAAVTRWGPTVRQTEALRHVLDGVSNKEIARRMGVSPRTVEVHVTALLDKAGVDSRARLIARARELAGVP